MSDEIKKEIDTENLPHKNKRIDWVKVSELKCKIPFIYYEFKGIIDVLNYNSQTRMITIKYEDRVKTMNVGDFTKCHFGRLISPNYKHNRTVNNKKYKYKSGDLIENKFSTIKILELIRLANNKSTKKGYEYICLKCGNKDVIDEYSINNNQGCNVCCIPSQKILLGYNDISTTSPWMNKYFKHKEDLYKYTDKSSKKVIAICPDCGSEKKISIRDLNLQGLGCPKCGDGISYPQKISYSILEQLNLNFETEYSPIWSKPKRYDFYFNYNNEEYIIEANGRQHYENHGFDNCGGRPLDEEIENDLIKKELALSNGIKEDNYIVIDCRKSKLEFIKQNILNSNLSKMFDLSKIDWLKCEEYTCSNLLKQACDLWNSGIHSTVEIGSLLKLDGSTIRKYLIKGTKVNLCKYNSVESKRYASTVGDFNQRKVINLSTLEVFDKIKIANKKYNTSKVGMACDGSRKSAGGHMWMYYDEYLKQGNIKKMLN